MITKVILFWFSIWGTSEILLPELPSYTNENVNMMWTSISAYGNSVAAFQQGIRSGKLNIWVMREYRVALL